MGAGVGVLFIVRNVEIVNRRTIFVDCGPAIGSCFFKAFLIGERGNARAGDSLDGEVDGVATVGVLGNHTDGVETSGGVADSDGVASAGNGADTRSPGEGHGVVGGVTLNMVSNIGVGGIQLSHAGARDIVEGSTGGTNLEVVDCQYAIISRMLERDGNGLTGIFFKVDRHTLKTIGVAIIGIHSVGGSGGVDGHKVVTHSTLFKVWEFTIDIVSHLVAIGVGGEGESGRSHGATNTQAHHGALSHVANGGHDIEATSRGDSPCVHGSCRVGEIVRPREGGDLCAQCHGEQHCHRES